MNEPNYPPAPSRIVEPVVSPETAAPTSAVCVECTVAGDDAILAHASRKGRAKAAPEPDDSDPTPQGAD